MKLKVVAGLCFLVAFLILLQQFIVYGAWFSVSDVHHETFAIGCVMLGIGLVLGKRFKK